MAYCFKKQKILRKYSENFFMHYPNILYALS